MTDENTLSDLCAEKAPFSFDIDKLRGWYEEISQNYSPLMTGYGENWGGWGVWTHTGDYKEGFIKGRHMTTEAKDKMHEDRPGFKNAFGQRVPSEVCYGYMEEMMSQIWDLGLRQSRVRCAKLRPHSRTNWHRDLDADIYMVRLHIPIYTNEKAVFSIEDDETKQRFSKNLPADGSAYFCSVNMFHQASNDGDDERVHLLMDVMDRGISKHHSFPAYLNRARRQGLKPRDGAQKF